MKTEKKKRLSIDNTNTIKENENYHGKLINLKRKIMSYKVNIESIKNSKYLTEDLDLCNSSSNIGYFCLQPEYNYILLF